MLTKLGSLLPFGKPRKWSRKRVKLRFDVSAPDFAKLDQGQKEIPDALLMRDLIVEGAAKNNPNPLRVLDCGTGAGFYASALQKKFPDASLSLLDFSSEMLLVAIHKLGRENIAQAFCQDLLEVQLNSEHYDIITASAVLHHLREVEEWEAVFKKLYAALRSGGTLWVMDLIDFEDSQEKERAYAEYANYLEQLGGKSYQKRLFRFIEKEDSPRPLPFQLNLLSRVGFSHVDVVHQTMCFAAFGARK